MHIRPFASFGLLVGVVSAASIGAQSNAQVVGELWQKQASAAGDATIANKPSGAPDAMFNPTAISYNSQLTGYTPATFLNHPTFYNTSAGFDPNGDLNNTYFLFTGQMYLNAGANSFVTPHDDGFEFKIPGITFASTGTDTLSHPGPTAPVNTPYTVNAPSAGFYNFTLSYGEVQGPPAVLGITINDIPIGNPPGTEAPDASTTLSMLGGACALLGTIRRFIKR